MSIFGCDSRYNCSILGIIASIIIGIVGAFLRFSSTITVTPAFLWTLFGIAIVYLAILVATSLATGVPGACGSVTSLLWGILGTVLFSVVLLGVPFTATSTVAAIITGLLLFFFTLLVTSAACTVRCFTRSGN